MEKEELMEERPDDEVCPKCGSHKVKCCGTVASGELMGWKCKDCGHYWEERC